MHGSWIGAGARVESLQIPCIMHCNFFAAEVKCDGTVEKLILWYSKDAVTGSVISG